MATALVIHCIIYLNVDVVIAAAYKIRNINLNGQKVQLNPNGTARAMSSVVALCWTPTIKWPSFSP
jgi:hypothetical protein